MAAAPSMWGAAGEPGYDPTAMGQPVTVIEKPSNQGGVVRFEINRTLTGMGHDTYAPCSLKDLQDKGYDYWALGHIHQPVIG